jgi:hypothetical protein
MMMEHAPTDPSDRQETVIDSPPVRPPPPESPPVPRRKRIAHTLRDAPLGILLMAAVFAMIGMTSMMGGGWLVVFGSSGSLWAGLVAVVAGPAILYLCVHLVQLTRWSWSAVIMVVALMLGSSLIRAAVSPAVDASVIAEIIAELGIGYYLTRPGIRAAFGVSRAG